MKSRIGAGGGLLTTLTLSFSKKRGSVRAEYEQEETVEEMVKEKMNGKERCYWDELLLMIFGC